MIKQMKYFQAVVKFQSFTKAADECYISQSAISQQIQALEKDLGVKLIKREGRKFSLTQAGEFFYRKSLVLVNDFDRVCRETLKLAGGGEQKISIGYLRHYDGQELKNAVAKFNEKYPEIFIELVTGTHEELYDLLRTGKVDLVLSDLRRNPSDQYVNFFLAEKNFYAELPAKNPLTQLEKLTAEDLKNTPVILVAPASERHGEEIFYRDYLGLKCEFIFAENLNDAHLMVFANRGFFLTDFKTPPNNSDLLKYIPIVSADKQPCRKYYAFWKIESSRPVLEDFAEILSREFC